MSIADLLAQATPQAQYYDYDRKIMEDYDNRAKIYSDAFDKYQKDFADYQTKVDDFNLMVDQYNKNLADPTFTGTAPVFKGGAEPIAPVDPGFSQGDIDAFIDEATARATRRGQTAATAFNIFQQGGNYATAPQVQGGAGVSTQPEFSFSGSGFADGGAVVPPPTDPPVLAPARNEGALGLGYYIPPGFREFVRNFRAFAGAIDPVQGIRRAMEASGRAFDSELSPEERKAAAVEAALETLAPVGMIGMGALAKQPIKATLMDVLTPTGAPASMTDEAVEAVSDPSRRDFMKGAAATGGIAALAPDLAMEAMNKVPAAVSKTTAGMIGKTAIDNAAENLILLRRKIDEADELRDEVLEQVGDGVEAQSLQREIFNNQKEMEDVVRDSLYDMRPDTYKEVSDEALERVGEFYYDIENLDIDIMQFKDLAKEAEKRGLHNVQNEKGIFQFPNLKSLVEQVDFEMTERALKLENLAPSITYVKPIKLEMTDDSGKSTEQLIKELGEDAFKSQYEFVKKQLEMETDLSPEEIDRIARINASRKGRNMAEGGVVSFAPYLR